MASGKSGSDTDTGKDAPNWRDLFAVWQTNGFALADIPADADIDGEAYEEHLIALQDRIRELQLAFLYNRLKGVIIFEGWDAAGKGGIIRRLSSVMDPRAVRVWPISAPDAREREEHYLQRFWRRLPANGELGVFDRSWYGRVLVERVEGFADREAWSRAYDEINSFERALAADGFRLVKIFLHISPEVQAKRFLERLDNPLKRWKLTPDDLRNRDKWGAYEDAIEEMVRRTSAPDAPWHVIPSHSKKFARLAALHTIIETLGAGVSLEPPLPSPAFLDEAHAALGAIPDGLMAKAKDAAADDAALAGADSAGKKG
ncbi:polyphosphate kinase 2 family protein [Pyruvatibacter mobilis]|uniref:polyphosphate kinase 2 family protein n=1 Tax=Pyruvatibacter mobilis TaxID=1712261 RepID=UPI003D0B82D3